MHNIVRRALALGATAAALGGCFYIPGGGGGGSTVRFDLTPAIVNVTADLTATETNPQTLTFTVTQTGNGTGDGTFGTGLGLEPYVGGPNGIAAIRDDLDCSTPNVPNAPGDTCTVLLYFIPTGDPLLPGVYTYNLSVSGGTGALGDTSKVFLTVPAS